MTKEELEKEADTPCTKCIFKGKCPSENKEEVYKICKEISGGGQKMTKEELIKNQFPNDEFLQSGVSQIVDKCIADLEKENAELKEKLEKATTHRISNCNKANEWHYVKDELPELYKDVLVVFPRGDCDVKRLTNHNEWVGRGSWCSLTDVIAWKEIVLPELKESE